MTDASEASCDATGPLVGVVGGSRSDFPVLEQATAALLDRLGVPCELRVVSAHRSPDLLYRYAEAARGRGIRVIIAGAGGAAHLPGMLAAKTTLPVIGVPMPTKALDGLDSLLSIVQMPRGIPVATVAIGNARERRAPRRRDPRPRRPGPRRTPRGVPGRPDADGHRRPIERDADLTTGPGMDDESRWEAGMPVLDRQAIGADRRGRPDSGHAGRRRSSATTSTSPRSRSSRAPSAITALEAGTPLSSPLVKLCALVAAPIFVVTTADAALRFYRSAWAWMPIDRGRGLFRLTWVLAALLGIVVAVGAARPHPRGMNRRGPDGRSTDLPAGGGMPPWLAASLNHCARCGGPLAARARSRATRGLACPARRAATSRTSIRGSS